MKKILTFIMLTSFITNSSFASDCLDPKNSEQVFNSIFKDETTIAVYCENTTEKVETCMVFNEPNLIVSFKKVNIIFNNEEKFSLCNFNAINISNGNIIYKKIEEKKES
ncbi:MAG: hypothetical protein QXR30_03745 [Candidatus Woesearchaeota archaeon]